MQAIWKTRCLVGMIAVCLAGHVALANEVTWTIDQSVSKLTMAIPDQTLNLNGTIAILRMRNQSGTGTSWNQGNSANLAGTFLSEYKELSGGPSLQFTTGGSVVGVNSGNYRPNPAAYSPFPNSDTGSYLNNSLAPAVFGTKARGTVTLLNVDLGYFSFHNVLFDLAGTSALAGSNGNYSYAATQAALGLDNADIAIQGLPGPIGQFLPNSIENISSNAVALSAGTATIVNTGGLNRRMTIPISVTGGFDLSGTPIVFSFTGQIQATAVVPEPSSLVLAGVGAASIMVTARRRFIRQSDRSHRLTSPKERVIC